MEHLSKEQRASIFADMRSDGMSLRAIAEVTGVSKDTVRRELAGVAFATPEGVTGRDGKSYPAQQPKAHAGAVHHRRQRSAKSNCKSARARARRGRSRR